MTSVEELKRIPFQTVKEMKNRINSMTRENRNLAVSDKTLTMVIYDLIDEEVEMIREDLKAYARKRLLR